MNYIKPEQMSFSEMEKALMDTDNEVFKALLDMDITDVKLLQPVAPSLNSHGFFKVVHLVCCTKTELFRLAKEAMLYENNISELGCEAVIYAIYSLGLSLTDEQFVTLEYIEQLKKEFSQLDEHTIKNTANKYLNAFLDLNINKFFYSETDLLRLRDLEISKLREALNSRELRLRYPVVFKVLKNKVKRFNLEPNENDAPYHIWKTSILANAWSMNDTLRLLIRATNVASDKQLTPTSKQKTFKPVDINSIPEEYLETYKIGASILTQRQLENQSTTNRILPRLIARGRNAMADLPIKRVKLPQRLVEMSNRDILELVAEDPALIEELDPNFIQENSKYLISILLNTDISNSVREDLILFIIDRVKDAVSPKSSIEISSSIKEENNNPTKQLIN